MKKFLLAATFLLIFISISLFFLVATFDMTAASSQNVSTFSNRMVDGTNKIVSPIDSYYAQSQTGAKTMAAVGRSDSRPVIVDNFLSRHKSPMSGMGAVFVREADKYEIDYRLLPAIAFQESTLGKRIPRDSHNAFGWAIYTGATSGAKFNDWEHAIEVVAKGLKTKYIDQGLNSTESIMSRYTPDSDGSWAFGVNFAIDEMTPK